MTDILAGFSPRFMAVMDPDRDADALIAELVAGMTEESRERIIHHACECGEWHAVGDAATVNASTCPMCGRTLWPNTRTERRAS